jgi:CIC family chloride channel protein
MSGNIRRSLPILDRFQFSGTWLFGGAALLVGLLAGAGVWIFKWLIDFFNRAMFSWLGGALNPIGKWTVALIPTIGGLLVGLLAYYFIRQERHHGVAGIMEAVALSGGRLRYNRMPYKAVGSALSIGSGASVGPEDPSVQIGANIGSFFGQKLGMSDERVRTLVAAGAAGGIAAGFNAPIAGVFFALEIILGEVSGPSFGVVILASVASCVFYQYVSGAQPALSVPAYAFGSPLELPLYLVLGLISGLIAALYVWLLYLMQDAFNKLSIPRWIKPALAGLAVGIVGIWLPQIFGVGYETIENILNGQTVAIGLLLALLVAKLILTPVSIGGGFLGGVFAPSLFMGAAMGGAFGVFVERIFPGLNIQPAAFAMVGMSAVLAGSVHAPLTAIILLFEMTNDYRIILPLMFAVTISLLLSRALQPESVYSLGLLRKGIRLDRGRDVDVLEGITVNEVMQREEEPLSESLPLLQAAQIMAQNRRHGLPVVDSSGRLVGILTLQDIDRNQSNDKAIKTVGEACTRLLLVAYPDESIGKALRKMSARDLGRLPVVARSDTRQLLGMLHRSDVVRAYEIASTRRAALRHRTHQVRLDAISPEAVNVTEMVVEAGSACEGQTMRDIRWPEESLIASIRRGRKVFIPHGETLLQAGDVLVVVGNEEAIQSVSRLCSFQRDET